MIKRMYYSLHRLMARKTERGSYSSGIWQYGVRDAVVRLAAGCPGKRILEVGCGEGLLLEKLAGVAGAELELYGVDTDPGRLSLARTRMGTSAALSVQSGTALSFADASFDVVIAGNLFFNLASFEAVKDVLGEMKRVCAPGGSLIFDFRNKRNVLLRLKYSLAPLYAGTLAGLPLNPYDPDEVRRHLGDMGLVVDAWEYVGKWLLPPPPVIVVKARVPAGIAV